MLACFETVFAEVKVIADSAFEPGAVDREHLAAVAPAMRKESRHLRCEIHNFCLERIENDVLDGVGKKGSQFNVAQ